MTDDVATVYLAGAGRSGSTLLERILATPPGWCDLGELVGVFRYGVLGRERCGCGAAFLGCPFWTAVGERAFGGWDEAVARRVVTLRERRLRQRTLPATAVRARRHGWTGDDAFYTDTYRRVADAAAAEAGARVVVDASKDVAHAYALHRSGVALRVVHLVRDPRGVAWSWSKQGIRRPDAGVVEEQHMAVYGTAAVVSKWNRANVVAAGMRRAARWGSLVAYEDLVRSPRATTARVVGELGLSADLSFLGADTVELRTTHALGGNPMRARTGPVRLQVDDAWRREMPRGRRLTVAALTVPGRLATRPDRAHATAGRAA